QAEDGIRDPLVTGVQTCALPIWTAHASQMALGRYSAGRARRERRIDPLLEHVTRQTANGTRILPAFENGRRSDAWRLLEAIMREIGRASCRDRGERRGVGGVVTA